jgi:carbon monoxide dehydrogenase subunit G
MSLERFRHGVEIGASPAAIWPFLVEPALVHRWSEGRAVIEPDPRFPELGSWAVVRVQAGGVSTWRARVAELDPLRRVRLELEGFQGLQGVRAQLALELQEWVHTTQLRWAVDLPLRGSSRQLTAALGARLGAPCSRVLVRRLLRRLRDAVEGPEARERRRLGLL